MGAEVFDTTPDPTTELPADSHDTMYLLTCRLPASQQSGLPEVDVEGHADLAARLWRAQGMRIVNAGKSKYYTAALSNFHRAKRCFERAGLTAQWEATVAQVRADHRRKSGFMLGFEHVVAGGAPREEPSFLERAKARWNKQQGQAR